MGAYMASIGGQRDAVAEESDSKFDIKHIGDRSQQEQIIFPCLRKVRLISTLVQSGYCMDEQVHARCVHIEASLILAFSSTC